MATARIWLCAVLGVNVLVVTSLYVTTGASRTALLSLGRIFGLYGALLMAFQLLLVARLPWLDRRLGMDRLTSLHRWNGFSVLWLLIGHTVFTTLGFLERVTPLQLMFGAAGVLRAVVAFALVVGVAVASARWARRRLAYETWHFLHLYTYVAVVLAFSHQLVVGPSFTGNAVSRAYWWTLWGAALGAVLVGRVLLPLRRNVKHRLRVSAVVPESADVVSVYVTGRRLDELPARAGQFFLWRFLTRDRWWQANPFSLSAAPDGSSLRLTAKALGAGSAALRSLKPGTRVFAEGPYGAFTTLHQRMPNAVLIAGGVGVTPIRALLEDIRGHVVVLYRVNTANDAVLLWELVDIGYRRGADVHLLTGPPTAANRNGLLLGADNLLALVPDLRQRDVFLCGPPPMVRATMASLRELSVPPALIHTERFSLAS
ncbi:oxidoreductase [Lentzea tibetensis]|uniref:Oxidoreductase n=1 Tax=Lentzea tibetensis TaxID=2591470 RepID=A0A563EWG5_9PSEU|nr:ferredoxin reductase family protein [Lentzea tibetensis]TWP51993.1 oxidoreductase [Lentzea tibetensis]